MRYFTASIAFLFVVAMGNGQEQSLAGDWRFRLDSANEGLSQHWAETVLPHTVRLPGSCEEYGFGYKNDIRDKDRLTRPVKYEGKAWYQRTIDLDAAWEGKRVELFLERCHLESSVWIDGKPYGLRRSLSTPHRHDLGVLPTGKHELTICINNAYQLPIGKWGFAITEDTQGNWNGIIGRIELRASDPVWIREVQVHPDHLQVSCGNVSGKPQAANLFGQAVTVPVTGTTVNVPFHPASATWDEFSPNLQTLVVPLNTIDFADTMRVRFGWRQLSAKNGQFVLNGRPILIRGPVNECVYPLTGYPPMDKASWARVLNICKSYGFNFMRFNSWCPPAAAFEAADELGMLLQVELPFWSMDAPQFAEDPGRDQFLEEELYAILAAYGNHPSFAFMAMGNESPGPLDVLVNKGRLADTRMLYRCQDGDTITKGDYAERGTEIGQRGTRGPRTDWDRWTIFPDSLTKKYKTAAFPTIAHEVGQWASYPDFDQLKKFTGTMKPYNYERFQQSLQTHGMAGMDKAFAGASGRFAVSIYKEEIEACLRTFPHGGFQVVEARDFPGEGGALIGWLDAFWDSKGFITPEAFRRFCAPAVCLLRMPKRVYTNTESFTAGAEIALYGPLDVPAAAEWSIRDAGGKLLFSGLFPGQHLQTGRLTPLGDIHVPLERIRKPMQLSVTVSAGGVSNSWNIWVYPGEPSPPQKKVKVVYAFDDAARAALAKGERVVLFSSPRAGLYDIKPQFGWCFGWLPERDSAGVRPEDKIQFPPVQKGRSAIPGSFMPAFWSMRLFNQVGTMGVLCNPAHPALAGFPTEEWSDWQWADLLGNFTAKQSYEISTDYTPHDWQDVHDRSKAIILNETPAAYRPIVQVIDNYERNYKLGLVFETKVGKGSLLICAMDLDTDSANRPAARAMKASLLAYAAGKKFKPAYELSLDLLNRILTF